MSNLRLKDHTWDAANVYDSALGKTQEQINAEVGTSLAGKQGTLVSGENIKTVNGASILGSGNIEIQGGDDTDSYVENVIYNVNDTSTDFTQGTRTAPDPSVVVDNNTRCVSKLWHLHVGDAVAVTNIADGTKAYVMGVNEEGTQYFSSGWKTADYSTMVRDSDGYYFVIAAKAELTDAITPSDVTTVVTVTDRVSRIKLLENESDFTTRQCTYSTQINGAYAGFSIGVGAIANDKTSDTWNKRAHTLLKNYNGTASFGLSSYTKYKYAMKAFPLDQGYYDSGWKTEATQNFDFSRYREFGFNFMKVDSSAFTEEDLTEVLGLLQFTGSGEFIDCNVKDKVFANNYNLTAKKPFYHHLFVNYSEPIIPHQSIFDIQISKSLGFEVIEANIASTSDGVLIANHLDSGKFGRYFHHIDGETDISDISVNSVTWDWVAANVRYNSTLAKYQVRPTRFDEFCSACKQHGLIPFIRAAGFPDAIRIAQEIMGAENYIVEGFSREQCPFATIALTENGVKTAEHLDYLCKTIKPPFIYLLLKPEQNTDVQLKALITTAHNNGCLIGTAYREQFWSKYAAMGMDVIAAISSMNRIVTGNICNYWSGENWSDFTLTGSPTNTNGVLTFGSSGTIAPNVTATTYPICGIDIEILFTGTITVPAKGEMSSYSYTGDGNIPVFLTIPILNGTPQITISVAQGAVVSDFKFRASSFMT